LIKNAIIFKFSPLQFANLRIEEGKMSDSAWEYLMAHKFGKVKNAGDKQLSNQSLPFLSL
jgi:hypothetical protein